MKKSVLYLISGACLFVASAAHAAEYATLRNLDFSDQFAIDIDGGSGEYGGSIIMRKNTGNKGQFWQMHDLGDGFVTLHSDDGLTGECMTVAADDTLEFVVRVDVCGEDEPRDYWSMEFHPDGMIIRNAFTGPEYCMTLSREGEFEWIASMSFCEGRKDQIWVASPTGTYGPD